MDNRLSYPAPHPAFRYPPDETLEDLRQRVSRLLDDKAAGRWALLQAEWLYDLALLTNDFRVWMQRVDQRYDNSR